MPVLIEEEREGVLLLTLNRPETHNAISSELAVRMAESLSGAAERRDIRSVIITGAGERAFSSGTDLKERRDLSPDEKWAQRTRGWQVNQLIWRMPQPVIAAIKGYCLGGGLELALFCDLRVAAEDALFSFPEMTLGAFPGSGAAIALPRLIGRGRAKEMLFTARRLTAAQALALGLVEHVVPKDQVLEKALAIAEAIKGCSPLGVAGVKRMVNIGADLGFEGASALNDAIRRPLEATRDYEEGIRAFFEKRKPVFRGE